MSVKLCEVGKERYRSFQEMNDGDIGIITTSPHFEYTGRIVQRYGDDIVMLGESWAGWTKGATEISTIQVRILQPGEILEIV